MKNNMQADNHASLRLRRLLYVTAAFLIVGGCTHPTGNEVAPDLQLLAGGVYGTVHTRGADSLPHAKDGDVLVLNMEYRTSTDSLLFGSREMPGVFRMRLAVPADTSAPSAENIFASMRPGDSVSFYLAAVSFFETNFKAELPAYIKPGDSLRFAVGLVRIETDSVVQTSRAKLEKSYMSEEDALIADYAELHMQGIIPLDNGLYIKLIKRGRGSKPLPGETVTMHYTLSLLNGEVMFTTVKKNRPFEFQMGSEMVIPGLEMATAMLERGSHALLLIPSQLAYGHEGYKIIKPFTPLIFEVKIAE